MASSRRVPLFVFFSFFPLALAACAGSSSETDDAEMVEGAVGPSAPITERNWISHPRIVAIRQMVAEVDAAETGGRFRELRKEISCEGPGEMSRTKVTDGEKFRKISAESGSEDSARTRTVYYDAQGKARFVFDRSSSVHGFTTEHRIYRSEGVSPWAVVRSGPTEEIARARYETATDLDLLHLTPLESDFQNDWWSAPPRCAQ